MKDRYIVDWIKTTNGEIPKISTTLSLHDKWNNLKVRIGISRMDYNVEPGIYVTGNPDVNSKVFVSANYKLSFDALRKELKNIDAWILVIDTKGINVWCAAGKGTFGTDELVNRINLTNLEKIVTHKKIIVPQLGAPGVSAHLVKKQSGFSVIYGPVKASDLPEFLENKMEATEKMRQVYFTINERLKLIPLECVAGGKIFILTLAIFFLLSGISITGFSIDHTRTIGLYSFINLSFAFIAGTILGPALLPWLPGRYFFVKGFFVGIIVFIVSFLNNLTGNNLLDIIAWFLLISTIASYLTMNFTGSSTYTSLSGVLKEIRLAIPIQIAVASLGLIFWFAGRFIFINGVL